MPSSFALAIIPLARKSILLILPSRAYSHFPVSSDSRKEATAIDRTGTVLKNRYPLIGRIGKGGGGTLYLARDTELSNLWAVKEIPAGRRREARLLQRLQHPAIPRMVDYCEQDGACFLIMEYIQGTSLDTLLREGKTLSSRELLALTHTILHILSYLHSQNPPIIYGDLKPANLMAAANGTLYLVDLGSAIVWDGEDPPEVEGTRGYAAPEQYEGRILPQSDFYALGKTIQALSGGRPPLPLRLLVRRCLKADPAKRPQSAAELEKALKRYQTLPRLLLPLLLLAVLPPLFLLRKPATPAAIVSPAAVPTLAPTPTPTAAPTPTPSPTPTPTAAPAPTSTPTPTPIPPQEKLTELLAERIWEKAPDAEEGEILSLSLSAKETKKLLRRLLKIQEETTDPRERKELALRIAALQEYSSAPEEAVKTLFAALLEAPGDPDLLSSLGNLLLREGKSLESSQLHEEHLPSLAGEGELPTREQRLWERSLP